MPYPNPGEKRYDVVMLANSRWAALAREVVKKLDPAITHHEIPPSDRDEVLERFGEARVLIHPLRIEGTSRVGAEARAMGAVPVVLESNPFRVGLDEENGAVPVGSVEAMPQAVTELLNDPDRLEELRRRGMRAARKQFDWESFVRSVDDALRRRPEEDPGREARAEIADHVAAAEAALRSELERSRLLAVGDVRWELEKANARERELADTVQTIRSSAIMRYTAPVRAAYYRLRWRR